MELTVSELAALAGGQLAPGANPALKITGAASLVEAGEGDVTFCGSPKYLAQLRESKASVALVPADFAEDVPAVCIRCENPSQAFATVLAKLAPPPIQWAPGVHPSAVIGRDVKLGEGVCIQPFAVIEDGAHIGDRTIIGAHGYVGHAARIGADTLLHPRVTVSARCLVGSRVILHSGVVIGSDGFGFEFQQGRHVKIPQTGIVQIDDDVEMGANTCVDRARFGRTWIGAGTKIDNLVQIAHNVVMGQHCIVCALVGIAGSVRIGKYVTIAGQAGMAGHLEIGDQITIAAQAGVTKSLKEKGMYMGYPAILAHEFREQVAHIHSLGRLKARVKALEQALGEAGKSLPPAS